MARTQFWKTGALLLVLGQTPPNSAIALDLGFHASASFEATFGLDQRTRDFIDSLPAKVREQVLGLLKDALPLIDKSILSYMEKVNDILDVQINHIECAAVGTGEVLGADLKSVLPFTNVPAPIAKLEGDAKSVVLGFSFKDSPHDIQTKYADLLYRAAVTACQVQLSPAPAKDVAAIQSNIHTRWSVWYHLDEECLDASSCYEKLNTQVEDDIKNSDPKDVAAINGVNRFLLISKPEDPSFFAWQYDPTEYEKTLGELISIHDGISVAKLTRQAIAKKALADATALLDIAQHTIDSAPTGYQNEQFNCDAPTQSKALALAAMKDYAVILNQITQSTYLDDNIKKDASVQSARLSSIKTKSAALVKAAKATSHIALGVGNPPSIVTRSCNL